MTASFKLDKWNSSRDGALNAQNMETKLKFKYGHRYYKYELPAGWSIGYQLLLLVSEKEENTLS